MSGVEVVGIVLGALPLLINGLEHYAEGMRTLKNMWNYEAAVDRLTSEFTLAYGIFRHSCEELLMPVLLDSELKKLFDGTSPNWEDEELDRKLRNRLGSDYEVYTRAVRILTRQIRLFTRKLKLDETTMKPPWISKDNSVDTSLRDKFFHSTWKRVKGGFDTPALTALLAEIKQSINQITKFVRGSIAIAPKRIALQRNTKMERWLGVRNHAKRIFELLETRWSCMCPYPHRASLQLDVYEADKRREDEEIRLSMAFTFNVDSGNIEARSLPWNLRNIYVIPSVGPDPSPNEITASPAARRVKFGPEPPKSSVASSISSTTTITSISQSVPEIADLCKTLTQVSPQHTSCIGYLCNKDGKHHIYSIANSRSVDDTPQILSFHELLQRRGNFGLSVKEKYGLAVRIALAVLQLHTTPWLHERWHLDDIHYILDKSANQGATQVYLSKSFSSSVQPSASHTSDCSRQSVVRHCIANETIFALGVALIEISFGVPILALKQDTDPDYPGFTDYFIAHRLVQEDAIKNRDHDKFAEVVLRCVRGQLSTTKANLSLEDGSVLESFFEDIVVPLQQIYDSLHGRDSMIL